jgi:DNA-binding beta-propeller fold protein YncE
MTLQTGFGLAALSAFLVGCSTPANCPTCGTTQNGTVVAIGAMEIPQASPFGKPFTVWDLVNVDTVNHRLYVTDRSHSAIAVFDTKTDTPIGQVKNGFVGSVCCEPDRASNFNEASGPNGTVWTPPTTPGGTLGNLWVSDGDSTLKVFNLDTDTLPVVHNDQKKQSFGTAVTGLPVFNIDDCARGTNVSGAPLGNPCGDMRADEPSFDPEHNKLIVTNGDGPNGAFITMVDTTNPLCAGNSCVQAQFFFDGGGDTVNNGCLGPNVSGVANANGTGAIRCRHVGNNPVTDTATNGLGGSIYNPVTHRFLQAVPQVGANPQDSEITEIDPVAYRVTNHFRMTAANGAAGCQPASLALGPSQNLLVGCANREGVAFPASTFIMDVSATGNGRIIQSIYNTGRADQVWYNPGDQRFYVAARDMENGSFIGIIDATNNMWLYNAPTGGNSHGIAADPLNNHIYVPLAPNPRCGRFSAEGCIAIYAAQ